LGIEERTYFASSKSCEPKYSGKAIKEIKRIERKVLGIKERPYFASSKSCEPEYSGKAMQRLTCFSFSWKRSWKNVHTVTFQNLF
jgi:hypothetical protein